METIKLKNPLKVNGKDVSELRCDLDAITVDGFAEADAKAAAKRGAAVTVAESDYMMHLYLGFEGIAAAMPEVDINDLERLGGTDIAAVMRAGRFFFTDSDVDSGQEPSEDASESTPTNSDARRSK